jgi:hypothetical protein
MRIGNRGSSTRIDMLTGEADAARDLRSKEIA